MGPQAIIHFRLGFSMKSTIQLLGDPHGNQLESSETTNGHQEEKTGLP
jgi:hypothetical protein